MSAEAASEQGRVHRPRGWAKSVTDALSPAHIVIALPVLVGWHQTAPSATGLWWGLWCSLVCGVVPYSFVAYGVRRRRFSDVHLRIRRQRFIPIAVALGAIVACVSVLAACHAPRVLMALLASMFATLAAVGAVTTRWQISGHTTVSGGAVGILAACFGVWVLLFAPVVVVIAASRVTLRDHTAAQVVAGAILGATLAPTVVLVLR